jgi:hypothetical protein
MQDTSEMCAGSELPWHTQNQPENPFDALVRAEFRTVITELITQFPEVWQEAIRLCEGEGLTIREASDVLGASPWTVGEKRRQALSRLRRLLIESGAGDLVAHFLGVRETRRKRDEIRYYRWNAKQAAYSAYRWQIRNRRHW